MEAYTGKMKTTHGGTMPDFSTPGGWLQGAEPWQHSANSLPPEPYTVREARIHVRHVRDLLKSLDPSDAFNGVDCNSLSFLSVFTDGDLGGEGGIGARTGQRGQERVSQGPAKAPRAWLSHL